MMLTRKIAERICRKNFNHIGLYGDTKICRLIGFADDGEDFYYIVLEPDIKCFSGKTKRVWASMVGPFESLKKIHYRRYKQLDNLMTQIWNCPPAEVFEIIVPE